MGVFLGIRRMQQRGFALAGMLAAIANHGLQKDAGSCL